MECRGHVKETISAYTESTMQTTKHYELKGTFLLFFTDCPIPVDIQNANKLYDGLTNGSHTLYSCARGYTGSTHDSMALCVNGSWTTPDLYCEG